MVARCSGRQFDLRREDVDGDRRRPASVDHRRQPARLIGGLFDSETALTDHLHAQAAVLRNLKMAAMNIGVGELPAWYCPLLWWQVPR